METSAGHANREIRNRTIDIEVEIKRTMQNEERVKNMVTKEKQESIEKAEEFEIELKQIEISR